MPLKVPAEMLSMQRSNMHVSSVRGAKVQCVNNETRKVKSYSDLHGASMKCAKVI